MSAISDSLVRLSPINGDWVVDESEKFSPSALKLQDYYVRITGTGDFSVLDTGDGLIQVKTSYTEDSTVSIQLQLMEEEATINIRYGHPERGGRRWSVTLVDDAFSDELVLQAKQLYGLVEEAAIST